MEKKKYSVWIKFEDIEAPTAMFAIGRVMLHLNERAKPLKYTVLRDLMRDFYPNEKIK